MSNPAPGWYPHNSLSGFERYWNGTAWTEEVRKKKIIPPAAAKPSSSPAPAPPRETDADRQAKIVCQFCQERGGVTAKQVKRAKRKSATRILGAVVTAGGSLGVGGITKKGWVTELSCSNCGMKWDAPLAKP